jgi:hypothetical protein
MAAAGVIGWRLGAAGASEVTASASAPPSKAVVDPSPSPTATVAPTPASARPSTTPAATTLPPSTTLGVGGYLADREELVERAALARDGVEPYRSALDDLLAWADDAIDDRPRPAERLRIRGTEGPFVDDTATAYGLALAYVVTDERRFAERAAEFIMAWVETTTSTRDTCPDDGSCQTSLIIGRTAAGFVFAADLISDSGALSSDDDDRFRRWLRDVILPTASERPNNWGDAGTFMRVAVTDYLGDQAGFEAAIAKWRSLVDLIEADGHIPEEVARGRAGLGYTQEALDYKIAVAVIAERRGIDLWGYEGVDGGTLKGAVDYLARFMHDTDGWPWSERVRRRGPSPMWELAYAHWREEDWEDLVLERRPYGWPGHSAVRWTTLTSGIPIDRG